MTTKRRALIVASYEYQDDSLQKLVTPAQDAEALARVLEAPAIGGFDQVQVLTNRPAHEARFEIEAFFSRRKRDDLLLLYFSGHGIKDDDGRLYLAATNTQRGMFRSTAIPATFVNETMSDSRSRRQVLILDCCHSGAFARGMIAKGGESVDIRDRFQGRGRVVLTASNATQYAFQGDDIIGEGPQSVFTRHLVRGLETGEADLDADGMVTLDELYDYVYERVIDETPKQTPGKWVFDMQGDILIARNPHLIVKPVELTAELRQTIQSDRVWIRVGAIDELGHLLHGSDEGLALAARQALAQLVDDDSRRVSTAAARALGAAQDTGLPNDSTELVKVLLGASREKPEQVRESVTSGSLRRETEQYKMLDADRILWKKDGKEMVRVPAGRFLYGDGKQPRELPEFWIDKTPVTNAEYARFVQATVHDPPQHWKGKTPPVEIADHPVVYVSWHDAVVYAGWVGKRLLTEEEWEKAARGTDGRTYPWGDQEPTSELCNFGMNVKSTTPVGKYSPGGSSPYGCVDMAGNVWEWTASDYSNKSKVRRGGSYYDVPSRLRASYRSPYTPTDRHFYIGFRCVGVAPGR